MSAVRPTGTRRRFLGALAAAAMAGLAAGLATVETAAQQPDQSRWLKGRLLVAAPEIRDPRFTHTVIFMVEHDATGALGLVINRVLGTGPLAKLMESLKIDSTGASGDIRVHYGGPVEPQHPFIIHSAEYRSRGTRRVTDEVAVTSAPEVLLDIAKGTGPKRSVFALGYAGWGPGQLESEMQRRDWVSVPAESGLIFGADQDAKWERALAKLRIDL